LLKAAVSAVHDRSKAYGIQEEWRKVPVPKELEEAGMPAVLFKKGRKYLHFKVPGIQKRGPISIVLGGLDRLGRSLVDQHVYRMYQKVIQLQRADGQLVFIAACC
jgi:hypothetical protein